MQYIRYTFLYFYFFLLFMVFFCFLIDIYNNSLLSEYQPDTTVSWPSRTPRTPGLSDSRTPDFPAFRPRLFSSSSDSKSAHKCLRSTRTTRPKLLQPGSHLNTSARSTLAVDAVHWYKWWITKDQACSLWGTPAVMGLTLLTWPSTTTAWCLSLKYDVFFISSTM